MYNAYNFRTEICIIGLKMFSLKTMIAYLKPWIGLKLKPMFEIQKPKFKDL